MKITIYSYCVGVPVKDDAGRQRIKRLSRDFAMRRDAANALARMSGKHPVASVYELSESYDLTDAGQLRNYCSYVDSLFETCGEALQPA